jgi:hypothetical protein
MIKMKKIILFSICLLCFATACTKIDESVEDIGKYADQISGFEGTITYAKDGKPAVGYPVQIQVGNTNGTVRFDPFTGSFTPIPEPNSYFKEQITDEKGRFALTEVNRNLPIRYGFFNGLGNTPKRDFEYFLQEFSVAGVSQQLLQSNNLELELGKVKKIDIKLYEAYKLELILNANKVDFDDEVVVTGKRISPIDNKEYEIHSKLQIPRPTSPNDLPFIAISNGYKSKPNVPITLKIETFRNKVLKDTRTLVIKMDRKDNNIEVL